MSRPERSSLVSPRVGRTARDVVVTSPRAAVRRIVAGSIENLLTTWDRELSLFPYSSQIVDGRLVNDYDHPLAVRYTLNSLLGLARAAQAGEGPELGDVRSRFSAFHRTHADRITTLADTGLLTLVCAELENESGAKDALACARAWNTSSRYLVMQDVAWALWGSVAAHRIGLRGADSLASALLARITGQLTSPLGLPFHGPRRYRRRIVSFGALTYFLRGLSEAANALDEADADRLFRAGLEHALALQGPLGDWPWMIDPLSGRALDRYPVFAVHQDSMAMLFLLPSLERGVPGIEQAIDRSLDWALGRNELGVSMYGDDPVFFAYRSIERCERAPRLRRYGRSLNALTGRSAQNLPPSALRLNPECRSYHLGWILYAWCDQLAELKRG